MARRKTLPSEHLADDEGRRLFAEISELEEYYLTRLERKLLLANIEEISGICGEDCLLVELGNISPTTTHLLFERPGLAGAYVPIDGAPAQLERTSEALRREYPALEVRPVCANYREFPGLPVPARPCRKRVTFLPGSGIGDVDPDEAHEFLRTLASQSHHGDGLLIGVDLQKSRAVLEAAYNDSKGVTAAFNLNLLRRVNRELDADFDLDQFRHYAVYSEHWSRIEMRLISRSYQAVRCCGETITFVPGEPIVTGHSYKYTLDGFGALAKSAGFNVARVWTDARRWFAVIYLES
jgi:dimethylhistidine N-methyltransferase